MAADNELNRANIVSLHGTMTYLAISAKVGKDTWNRYVENLEGLDYECLERMDEFFTALFQGPWRKMHDIRYAQHGSEDMWQNYALLGLTNQPEQVIFNEAAREFREQWCKRPKRIKLKKLEEQDN